MRRYQIYQDEQADTWVLLDAETGLTLTIGTRAEVEVERHEQEQREDALQELADLGQQVDAELARPKREGK